ncbi:MAG: tetratricopeptide repeat protein [Verrucomicrobiae bacterium]|nr:tetratricopeptide repeat protein [Verrucomicrobiae bacterium]
MPTKEQLHDEGMFDFSMGEFDAAIDKFKQALALDANFFDANHSLGMAYYRAGQIDEAIATGLRSLEIKPADQLAHTSLSMYYVKKGMKPEAEHHGAQARIAGWKEELKSPPKKQS